MGSSTVAGVDTRLRRGVSSADGMSLMDRRSRLRRRPRAIRVLVVGTKRSRRQSTLTDYDFDIEEVTSKVKLSHAAKKEEEKELSEARDEFFAAATERLEQQPRATRTIIVPTSAGGKILASNEEVESYVHKYHPEWKIISIEDEPFRVLVEEDPAWMKYTYISEDRKTVFQRGITQASDYLDDDSLRQDDPDLWLRVTTSPEEDLLWKLAKEVGGENMAWNVRQFCTEHRDEFLRLLKPFDKLSEDDYVAVQQYIVPGALSYRLESPRKPKPEELE
jgi:hypothetical protein